MDKNSNSIERQGTSSTEVEKKQQQMTSPEVIETMEGVSEVIENVESGEVSEKTGEDKRRGPQGGFPSKGGGKKTQTQIKPLIFPKIEVMQIQIATSIKKEIAVLIEEAKKSKDKPYELNGSISKIRELKSILSSLTHLTIEALKNLWMRFVKKSS